MSQLYVTVTSLLLSSSLVFSLSSADHDGSLNLKVIFPSPHSYCAFFTYDTCSKICDVISCGVLVGFDAGYVFFVFILRNVSACVVNQCVCEQNFGETNTSWTCRLFVLVGFHLLII